MTGAQALGGRMTGVLSGVGGRAVTAILRPFTTLGGRLGGVLSGLGGVIARSRWGPSEEWWQQGLEGWGR